MIRTREQASKQARKEYLQLIETETHEYAITWLSIKLQMTVEDITSTMNEAHRCENLVSQLKSIKSLSN